MKERDYLIKEVFPEIRHRCHQKGIEFTEIDLRWGITEKQAQQGKVIEVCLKEIDRCRPFFIGILGDRYGWIPPTNEYFKHRRILEEFPWIKDDIKNDLSITEIEIQYGVLRNPTLSKNALFYLRKPQYSLTSSSEIPVSEDDVKLLELKKILLSQNDFPVKKFPTSDELGNLILKDLWKIIEKSFPDLVTHDPIEQERLEHTTFLKSRLRVYIGGQKYFNRLNAHAESEDPPLVITGNSGLGKSALLANWIIQYQRANPDTYILYHFTGGAPDSTDYVQIVRRILDELKLRFEIKDEIPNIPEKIIESFPKFLAQSGRYGKWVLIIDALNQLENTDNTHLLNWLPEYFPPFVRVIFSTLPGSILSVLKKRKYELVNIKPLTIKERIALIKNYLNQFGKAFQANVTNMIVKAKGFNNPLLLRTFLDEIRIFGEYERLKEKISHYVRFSNKDDFFNAILLRMEEDYEKDRKGLVGELLSLILASRKGLTERELLDISKVPTLYWSELNNSLETHLIRKNGLQNFFHDFIREAIEECYLKDDVSRKKVHRKLAKYFAENPLSERSLEELPYHLERSKQWKKLKDYIINIEVFLKIYERDEYELTHYWRCLNNRFDMGKEYSESVKNYLFKNKIRPEAKSKIYDSIGKFLTLNAKYKDAERMFKNSIRIKKGAFGENHLETAESFNNLADLYKKQTTQIKEAEKLFKKSLKIKEKVLGSEHLDTIKNMNSLSRFYEDQARFSEGIEISKRALILCDKVLGSQHPETASCLDNVAWIFFYNGQRYNDSISLFKRSLEIREKTFGKEHPLTANSYSNLGHNYSFQYRFKEAEPLLKEALKIYERILGPEHDDTAVSMEKLAVNYYVQSYYDEAEILLKRALNIKEKIHGYENPFVAHSVRYLAIVYEAQGKYSKAEQLYKCAIDIVTKKLGKDHSISILYLESLAEFYRKKGNYKKAERILKHTLTIRKKTLGSEHPEYAISLEKIANLLRNQGKFEKAEIYYNRSLDIFKKTYGNNNFETAFILYNFAKLNSEQKNYKKAETMFKQALRVIIKNQGSDNLNEATIQNDLALLHMKQYKYKEAEDLIKKSLSIRKSKLGESHIDTAESFVTFANLKEATRKYKQALDYYKKAYKIYESILGKRNKHTLDMKRSIESILKKTKKRPVNKIHLMEKNDK